MSEYTSYGLSKLTGEQVNAICREHDIAVECHETEALEWPTCLGLSASFDYEKNLPNELYPFIYYFEEENWQEWSLYIADETGSLYKKIYEDEEITFSSDEKDFCEKFFSLPFETMAPYFVPGKQKEFLELVKVPYVYMYDGTMHTPTSVTEDERAIMMSQVNSILENYAKQVDINSPDYNKQHVDFFDDILGKYLGKKDDTK